MPNPLPARRGRAASPAARRPAAARRWWRLLRPLASVVAVLYFLVDAVALAALRPALAWLGRQPVVVRVQRRVAALGPYATLAVILAPLAILEPAKPLGLYLVADGHAVAGAVVVVAAEALKIATVERLFRANRGKLLTIPWFARCYAAVTGWLAWLRALPPWRLAARAAARVRTRVRRVLVRLRRMR
ncbi:hypothetical protein [Azospirillum sp. ST 5-10]|uniref:hypothetical protein n=1 Tax=unclassified Azospirillum TaxID=2630922 RepID=UPI003F4A42A1